MKLDIDLLDRITKKKSQKNNIVIVFPHRDVTRNRCKITPPKKSLETFWPTYGLSIVIGLKLGTSLYLHGIMHRFALSFFSNQHRFSSGVWSSSCEEP